MEVHTFTVEDTSGARLDIYLSDRLPGLSRSSIQKLITRGSVTVDGVTQRASYKVQPGEQVVLTESPPEPTTIAAERIPLNILYEDESILVVNKPSGMTVHPAPGSREGTLVNAILAHCSSLSGVGGVERPGIVHRLDKDTSGILVVAKTDAAHSSLQHQISSRSAERKYLALVWGETQFSQAVVDAPLGRHPTDRQKMAVIHDTSRHTARQAVTDLSVFERFAGFTLLEARLQTGRTHQIRVHLSFINHPVVGDPTYGGRKRPLPPGYSKRAQQELQSLISDLHGQALHARLLAFDHPVSGRRLTFEAPLPADFGALLHWLRQR